MLEMLKIKLLSLLALLLLVFQAKSQSQFNLDKYLNHPWVDSVFNSLSPDERIAQLIWIDANSGDD